jgi:pentatricopeptide repeat protein
MLRGPHLGLGVAVPLPRRPPRHQRERQVTQFPAVSSRHWHHAASLNTRATIESSASFYQNQLEQAARYLDIDACIYLLQHHGKDNGLYIKSKTLHELVSTAFQRRQIEQAVDLVTVLPDLHAKHFSVLMKECLRRKDLKSLHLVINARTACGMPQDAYTTSAMITALGSLGRSADALNTMERAWNSLDSRTSHHSVRSVEVCNAAIGAAAVIGDWAAAQRALALLHSANLSPDIVTYNALIKTAGAAGMMDQVKSLYEELCLVSSGLKPNHLTYTSVFAAAARNRFSDATWLLSVYKDMKIQPNDFVLSSFFSAMSFAKCSQEQLDSILSAMSSARTNAPLNDTSYTALLKFLTRQNIADRAVDVWQAAQQDSVALSPHLMSALFDACASGESPALVDVALDGYVQFSEWWSAQDKTRIPAWVERDVRVAYNALLHFIGAENQMEQSLAVFEAMKRKGPLPDTVTYNTLLATAGRVGETETALRLYDEMNTVGCRPSERTFGALLHAFACAGDAKGALSMFRHGLKKAGIRPNHVLYTSLIDALVTAGDKESLHLAFSVADEMLAANAHPTAVTYGCLLVACDKLGDVGLAFDLYRQACARGIPPSDQMHDILIGACMRHGKLDDALDLVKTVARSHAPLQKHTMDSLVRALGGTSSGRALRTMSLMQTMGMVPSRETYLSLVASCAGEGKTVESLTLYKSMKYQGFEVDGSTGSLLIICLCQSHADLHEAVSVYEDMMVGAWTKRPEGGTNINGDAEIPLCKTSQSKPRARKSNLPKRAHVPDAYALASLSQAFAARGQLREAWRFYTQLRRWFEKGMQDTCATHRRMFEALIEGHCRSGNVQRALVVFDDWKAASTAWYAARGMPRSKTSEDSSDVDPEKSDPNMESYYEAKLTSLTRDMTVGSAMAICHPILKKRPPKLSNVTLAFLEACCRSETSLPEWRVYDVCSVMRTQKDRKLQETLDRPLKASHHVLGSVG